MAQQYETTQGKDQDRDLTMYRAWTEHLNDEAIARTGEITRASDLQKRLLISARHILNDLIQNGPDSPLAYPWTPTAGDQKLYDVRAELHPQIVTKLNPNELGITARLNFRTPLGIIRNVVGKLTVAVGPNVVQVIETPPTETHATDGMHPRHAEFSDLDPAPLDDDRLRLGRMALTLLNECAVYLESRGYPR